MEQYKKMKAIGTKMGLNLKISNDNVDLPTSLGRFGPTLYLNGINLYKNWKENGGENMEFIKYIFYFISVISIFSCNNNKEVLLDNREELAWKIVFDKYLSLNSQYDSLIMKTYIFDKKENLEKIMLFKSTGKVYQYNIIKNKTAVEIWANHSDFGEKWQRISKDSVKIGAVIYYQYFIGDTLFLEFEDSKSVLIKDEQFTLDDKNVYISH